MRILFATADPHGPQGWWRAHVPAAALRAAHHEAVSVPALTVDDRGRLIAAGLRHPMRAPQIVVLQGWFHPQAPELIRRARRAGQVIACDLDDDVWNIPPGNPAAEHAGNWRPYLEAIMAECDVVLCSTPAVAAAGSSYARDVAVCRNGVPAAMRPPAISAAPAGRVGWLGRTTYRGDDLRMIGPALRQLARTGAMSSFVHIGACDGDPAAAAVAGLTDHPLEVLPWCHVEVLHDLLAGLDLVVIPQAESVFANARSNATGLLCAAAGVPYIASRTPEYELLALDGCGLIADTSAEWVGHARLLLERREMADHGSHLALEALARGWLSSHTITGWTGALSRHLECRRAEPVARYAPRGVRGS